MKHRHWCVEAAAGQCLGNPVRELDRFGADTVTIAASPQLDDVGVMSRRFGLIGEVVYGTGRTATLRKLAVADAPPFGCEAIRFRPSKDLLFC